jgi:hypothetical protein
MEAGKFSFKFSRQTQKNIVGSSKYAYFRINSRMHWAPAALVYVFWRENLLVLFKIETFRTIRESFGTLRFWSPLEQFVSPSEHFWSPLEQFVSPSEHFWSPLEQFVSPSEHFWSPLEQFASPLERFSSPSECFTSP